MRLGSMTVVVGPDLTELDRGFDRARDKSFAAGQDMSRAIGEGMSRAGDHLKQFGDRTARFVQEHKVLLGSLAATAAGIWAYNNQDQVKAYWDRASTAAAGAAESIKGSLGGAYGDAGTIVSEMAAKSRAAFEGMGDAAAKAADDFASGWGKAGKEFATYFTSQALSGLGDAFLKIGDAAAKAGAEMDKLSHFTGQNAATLSQIKDVANQTGVDLTGAFKSLEAAADTQNEAGKMARDQLAAIGVAVADAGGQARSAQEIWVDLAEKMRLFGDRGEDAGKKLGILKNVIGEIDANKLSLLNEGGDANAARLEQAARLRAIYTDQVIADLARIQKERQIESAEELAWADRKNLLWAQMGSRFKVLAHDVEWGQKSFSDGISESWKIIGDFVGKYIDYLIQKYQSFLTFMSNTAGYIASAPGFGWMQGAADYLKGLSQQGPGKNPAVPALYGRNPDGSPKEQAPSGSETPPKPLAAPGASGTGGRDNELVILKAIAEIKNQALVEQSRLLGDQFGAEYYTAQKNAERELLDLENKLKDYAGANKMELEESGKYWIEYRMGIALARIEIEHARDVLARFGETQAKIGELTGDPSRVIEGKLAALQAAYDKEWDAIANDSLRDAEDRARVLTQLELRNALERRKIQVDALGDAAQLDDQYWAEKRANLERTLAAVKENASDETAYLVYASQQRSALAKAELDAKVKYADDFGDFISGRLSQDYGLYKDALARQRDLWEDFYAGLKDGFDSFANASVAALNGRTVELKRIFSDLLTELEKTAVHHVVVIPIVEQLVGVIGGGSGAASSSGGGIGGLLRQALSLGEKGYQAYSGEGLLGKIGNWLGLGSDASLAGVDLSSTAFGDAYAAMLGIKDTIAAGAVMESGLGTMTAMTGPTAAEVAAAFPALSETAAAQLSITAGGGLAGAGAEAAGAAGSTGLLSGLASSMGISTGMLASGIGALVAIPALLAMGFSKTTQTQMTGNSGLTINVHGGEVSPFGFSTWKQTESSMFGGESTSHFVMPYVLDPAVAAKVEEAVKSVNAQTLDWAKNLGLSTDSLKNADFVWNYTSADMSQLTADLKNLYSQTMADAAGMGEDLKNLTRSGESVGAAMDRLCSAMAEVSKDAQIAGIDLQKLSGGLSGLKLADYASRLVEVMGGTSGLQSAMNIFTKNTLSAPELAQNTINYLADQAGKAMAAIPGVDPASFWSSYQTAMAGQMSPEQFKTWADAASAMDTLNTAIQQAGSATGDVASSVDAAAQQMAQAAAQTANAMSSVVSSLDAAMSSLMTSADTSPLSGPDRSALAETLYDQLLAKAGAGDQDAMAQLAAQGQETLRIDKEVWGASERYFAEQQHVYDTWGEIRDQAQSAYDLAMTQVNATQGTTSAVYGTTAAVQSTSAAMTAAMTGALERVRQAILGANSPPAPAVSATPGASSGESSPPASPAVTGTSGNNPDWPGFTTYNPASMVPDVPGSVYETPWINTGESPFVIGAAASGGLRKGWTLVGEEGPELVNFTSPARVYSTRDSAAILGQSQTADVSGVEERLEAIYEVLSAQGQASDKLVAALVAEVADLKVQLRAIKNQNPGQVVGK